MVHNQTNKTAHNNNNNNNNNKQISNTGYTTKKVSSSSFPTFLRSQYIPSGYRVGYTPKQCLRSIFETHNETGNIWTCLLPVLLMFPLLRNIINENSFDGSAKVVFILSIVVVQISLLASVTFHTFGCISEAVALKLAILDYVGIFLIGLGVCTPGIFYGFYCHENIRNTYLFLNIANAVAGITMVCAIPQSRRSLRILVFCFAASFGIIFGVHQGILSGIYSVEFQQFSSPIIGYYVIMGCGLIVYALHLPERWVPGQYTWIGSHQLWHVMSITAIMYLFDGWLKFSKWKMQRGCFDNITEI